MFGACGVVSAAGLWQWTGEPGTGYLLLAVVVRDFGSSLGSGSSSAQQPRGGDEYLIDVARFSRALSRSVCGSAAG
jgi:hypothetical protein